MFMDIDKYLVPDFDFSRLGPIEIELMGDITFEEAVSALRNIRTTTLPDLGYPLKSNRWFSVGFGSRSRCLEILFQFSDDDKISFIDINLADEYGIELHWCRKGR
jgi:hypothetical protein